MNRKIFIIIIVIIMIAFGISGCGQKYTMDNSNKTSKINIYTNLYVLEEFSKKIGGEEVNIVNIVPPGVSPHDYELKPKDMVALIKSDIFVYNGAGLESWADKIKKNLDEAHVKIVKASNGIELMKGSDEHEGGSANHDDHNQTYDPHVWLNPLNAIIEAENIKNALVEIDPNHKDFYIQNYNDLKQQLLALDHKYQTELRHTKRKDIFVSHAAFGYLAKEYGIIQNPISGFIPSDEPSPAELKNMVNKAKELNIKYILVDPMESTKISKILADEVNAKTINVHTIASLSKEEIANGQNYITLMEQNLVTLKMALNE